MENTKLKGELSILKELIFFSIPLIVSGILQQLYSWADAFIIGNTEGEIALGAVGGTGTVVSFFLLAVTGFTVGTAVISGQKFGAGELGFINKLLGTFTVILACVFALFSVIGVIFAENILAFLDTPADTIMLAKDYLKIVLIGIPFLAVYNVYSAVIRGIGDSKAPFYSILISSVMNVILDILFVAVLKTGVKGAAFATVISQILMTLFIVLYTKFKHKEISFTVSFTKNIILTGIKFGIPPMLQSCITASGNLLLQGFMNSFGTATVIAITSSYRIDSLALLPVVNLGSAISTLSAQSYGAGNMKRTAKVKNAGIFLMAVVSALLTLLVIPFGSRLIAFFGAGAEAVQIGHDFFVRLASFYIIFGLMCAVRSHLEGIGDVTFSSILGITILFIRIVSSYLFAGLWGNMVIAYAEGISWALGFVMFYLRLKYKNKK